MKNKQNLHTHCSFCDGAQTPEQVIEFALEKGFTSLGFSSHSPLPQIGKDPVSSERIKLYDIEIPKLKEKYRDRIAIYHGIEYDYYSEPDLQRYEYVIASVHYMQVGDVYYGVDWSADELKYAIDNAFGGDEMAMVRKYYELVSRLPEGGQFDIIGHFDLLTKFCEKVELFDRKGGEYMAVATDAMDALRGKIPFFEVNTGAIARGYRTAPYPAPELVREFKKRGFGAVITSDCHDATKLDCEFEQARELLRSCGFTERYVLGENGFEAVEI